MRRRCVSRCLILFVTVYFIGGLYLYVVSSSGSDETSSRDYDAEVEGVKQHRERENENKNVVIEYNEKLLQFSVTERALIETQKRTTGQFKIDPDKVYLQSEHRNHNASFNKRIKRRRRRKIDNRVDFKRNHRHSGQNISIKNQSYLAIPVTFRYTKQRESKAHTKDKIPVHGYATTVVFNKNKTIERHRSNITRYKIQNPLYSQFDNERRIESKTLFSDTSNLTNLSSISNISQSNNSVRNVSFGINKSDKRVNDNRNSGLKKLLLLGKLLEKSMTTKSNSLSSFSFPPSSLPVDNVNMQQIFKDVYAYSAFYDERTEQNFIRIVLIARSNKNVDKIWCNFVSVRNNRK